MYFHGVIKIKSTNREREINPPFLVSAMKTRLKKCSQFIRGRYLFLMFVYVRACHSHTLHLLNTL